MRLIRSQLYNLLMYLAIFIVGIAYAPSAMRGKEGVHRAVTRFAKINRWLLWHICRIKTKTLGEVPDEPCLVCAKHMSFLDIVMIADALPNFTFIMKAELKYVPVIGFYAQRVGAVPVRRGKKGQAMAQMLTSLEQSDKDKQLVIFPQGTRVLPGAMRPYKKGAAAIYQAFDMPTYLVATNIGVLWARRSAYRHPGTAIVEFLPERIEPGMGGDEFMDLIEERIETRSNELMAKYPAES